MPTQRNRSQTASVAILGLLACLTFLGCLGSVDLWGKREQRSAAEAIDTITENHWLIAQIQNRPRLEKPPLPRWIIASLMTITNRRDEWIVRLPSALAAVGMVGLVYLLGKRIGGHEVGLASGLVLTSFGFFIAELRQAGNDGPLAFFTTLAIYAAWRRLHPEGAEPGIGARRWVILFSISLGLGFLTKGPIIILVVGMALLPYLLIEKRLKASLRLLVDSWGVLCFLGLALSWPVPVILSDPNAIRIWYLEMAQKTGTAGIHHAKYRPPLVVDWPWMAAPWVFIALSGMVIPFVKRSREDRPRGLWMLWFWTVGNLIMFCLWTVAKPNYYLPCMPGMAILCGLEWVRICREARAAVPLAIRMIQFHWVGWFSLALAAPVVASQLSPLLLPHITLIAAAVVLGVLGSAVIWRKGADAASLIPLTASMTFGVMIGYGAIAPRENGDHSHRDLALRLDALPIGTDEPLLFYHELDEGLWFYLKRHVLRPVPGTNPTYNEGFDLAEAASKHQLILDPTLRYEAEKIKLIDWARDTKNTSRYFLMREKDLKSFGTTLDKLVTPIYREPKRKRNELVLLKVSGHDLASEKSESMIR